MLIRWIKFLYCSILILISSTATFAQKDTNSVLNEAYNLFYLSKLVTEHTFSKLSDIDRERIISQLNLYAEKSGVVADSLIKRLNTKRSAYIIALESIQNNLTIIDTNNIKKIIAEKSRKKVIELIKNRNKYSYLLSKLNAIQTEIEVSNIQEVNIKEKRLQLDSIQNELNITRNKAYNINFNNLFTDTSNLKTIKLGINQFQIALVDTIKSLNQKLFEDLKLHANYNEINFPALWRPNFISSDQIQAQTAVVQTIQERGGINSFKIPTESEIIEAMAIFLANRTKQEAMIWFMDQIRSQINNPFIADAFPEVIELIQRSSEYKVPNFGTEWRYAISKDFMALPKNIFNSPWIHQFHLKNPKQREVILTAIDFSYELNKLMEGNYNYRDIIKHFYMNPVGILNNSNETANTINTSITLLYILTNEFFHIENFGDYKNAKFRLLTFEELMTLSNEEWNNLIELIHIKYFNKLPNKFQDIQLLKNIGLRKDWLANILNVLSQFDKLNNQIVNTELQQFTPNTIWNIVHTLLNNLSDGKNTNKEFNAIRQCIAIYELLKLKDFNAAAQQTLDLLQTIKIENNQLRKNQHMILDVNNKRKIIVSQVSNDTVHLTRLNNNKVNNNKDLTNSEQQDSILTQIIVKKRIGLQKTDLFFTHIGIPHNKDSISKISEVCIPFDNIAALAHYTSNNKDAKTLMEATLKSLNRMKDFQGLKAMLEPFNFSDLQMLKLLHYIYDLLDTSSNKPTIEYTKYLAAFPNAIPSKAVALVTNLEKQYFNQFSRLIGFFGDVHKAQNEKMLADIISNHVLPPTSYKLKKKMLWSLDLNAYVGIGANYLIPMTDSINFEKQTNYNVTAPIGITIAKSFKSTLFINHMALAINPIDIGQVVNHYLITPKQEYIGKVHFSEIFAPNLNVLFGFRNAPIVAFLGVKLIPLKPITIGNYQYNKASFDAFSLQAGLKFDLPLHNMYFKERGFKIKQ